MDMASVAAVEAGFRAQASLARPYLLFQAAAFLSPQAAAGVEAMRYRAQEAVQAERYRALVEAHLELEALRRERAAAE